MEPVWFRGCAHASLLEVIAGDTYPASVGALQLSTDAGGILWEFELAPATDTRDVGQSCPLP